MTELMKKKLEGKKGFTLVELLIVVAIIAILVAVSIPVYSNYTENVNKGVDQANERDAIGLATTAALTKDENTVTWATDGTGTAFYSVTGNKGQLIKTAPTGEAAQYGKCSDHKGGYIEVAIDANNNVTVSWIVGGASVTDKNHGIK